MRNSAGWPAFNIYGRDITIPAGHFSSTVISRYETPSSSNTFYPELARLLTSFASKAIASIQHYKQPEIASMRLP
jgi:hypothetical protein